MVEKMRSAERGIQKYAEFKIFLQAIFNLTYCQSWFNLKVAGPKRMSDEDDASTSVDTNGFYSNSGAPFSVTDHQWKMEAAASRCMWDVQVEENSM
jgi:hypothetical protein